MTSSAAQGFNPESLLRQEQVIIDARSESEYLSGHIPGSYNIPILNNEHRHLVGTCYKNEGRDAAVRLGFKLAGPLFAEMIARADSLSNSRKVLIYCWRGGMRSAFLAWILSAAGFKVELIKGGYKNFRQWVLTALDHPPEILIIGGKTGSGKTEMLKTLSADWPVIDLEHLASHRGSAFGALGLPPQPSYEQFENMLALEFFRLKEHRFVLLENESRMIGKVKIPDTIFAAMREARVLKVEIPLRERIRNILDEYGQFSNELLAESTAKLQRKLGGLRLKKALEALQDGRREVWLEILLEYYDENYEWSQSQRDPEKTIRFEGSRQDCLSGIEAYLNKKRG
jgi:tRNA 2-selenouridine synthase